MNLKIGLIDVDSHNFPNLCLMKLSAYHKAAGDKVEWWRPFRRYDIVYKSRVFTDTYSKDEITVRNAARVIKGGTGYGTDNALPYDVEHTRPDYSLYPQFPGTAYGFLSRGCPRNCGFCIVSGKEGRKSVHTADLSEFWNGQRNIKLLDPNLFASREWRDLSEQLIESGAWIDFTQGCDIRLMTWEKIQYIKRMKMKRIHFAWDQYEDKGLIVPKLKMFRELTGWDYRKMIVYVLTGYNTAIEQDLERIYILRELGYNPYVMIYNKETLPPRHILRRMQRWVNNRFIFEACRRFEDYTG